MHEYKKPEILVIYLEWADIVTTSDDPVAGGVAGDVTSGGSDGAIVGPGSDWE